MVDFVENFQGFFNVLLCLEYQKMEFRMTSHGGHSKLGFKSSFSSHSKFTLLGFGKWWGILSFSPTVYIYIISSVYAHATGLYLVIKWRARICQDDNFPTQWQTNEQQGGGWALITYGFPKTHTVPDANTYLPFCHICSRHSAESALHIKDQGLVFFFWIYRQMSAGISLQRPPEISCS